MQQIGRYQVVRELGRGAMGVVYEALDPLMKRTVAVKIIHPYALADPNEGIRMRESLFKEARAAAALSHQGIVIAYDCGEHQDGPCVAMELVRGPALHDVLAREGKLEFTRALDILRQTAGALDYAPKQAVIHRDIKPGNIMLQDSRVVKITDFGIAKNLASQHRTQFGLIAGSPSYMSPEQINAAEIDGGTDQYSLAVVAFEMLTGTKPFQAETMAALFSKVVHGPRPSARAVNPSLPAAVDRVLQRALAQRREQRYASCADFVSALKAASAQDAETVVMKNVPSARPRMKQVLPVGGGLLALLLGVLLWVLFSSRVKAQLTAEPDSIQSGELVLLRWETAGATSVEIDHGIGNVGTSGSMRVQPAEATTYVLLASGTRGTAYAKARVNVTKPSPTLPPTAQFTADPESIQEGESSTLHWTVERAVSVTIDNGIGNVTANGLQEVKPKRSTIYTLTATGAQGGTASARMSVTCGKGRRPRPHLQMFPRNRPMCATRKARRNLGKSPRSA